MATSPDDDKINIDQANTPSLLVKVLSRFMRQTKQAVTDLTSGTTAVSAHYYRSAAFATALPDATWEVMDYPTKEVDTHNAVTISTATNLWTPTFGAVGNGWRFVAPLAGTYLCAASVGLTAMNVPSSGREIIIEWIINGGVYMKRGTRMAVGASNNQGLHCATAIQLALGDVLQIRIYQASGGTKNIEAIREANWIAIDRIFS